MSQKNKKPGRKPEQKPVCHQCGRQLKIRAGACYICPECGESEGCG